MKFTHLKTISLVGLYLVVFLVILTLITNKLIFFILLIGSLFMTIIPVVIVSRNQSKLSKVKQWDMSE